MVHAQDCKRRSVLHQADESILWARRDASCNVRNSAAQTVLSSVPETTAENRAETAIEAHHETIQLHLFFPSMSTVSLASLHDCIFMGHQFTTCGVHPTIAFCLLSFLAEDASCSQCNQGSVGPTKRLKGRQKNDMLFSRTRNHMFRKKVYMDMYNWSGSS